jgi:hypothetical protein
MNSPTISGRRYLWDDSGWPAKPVEATVNEVHRFAWPNVEAEAIQRRQTKRAVATQRSDGDFDKAIALGRPLDLTDSRRYRGLVGSHLRLTRGQLPDR